MLLIIYLYLLIEKHLNIMLLFREIKNALLFHLVDVVLTVHSCLEGDGAYSS